MRYVLFLAGLAVAAPLRAQHPERLGTVDFKNSCSPAVQEQLQSAIAMLHSFRYGPGERAFREVLTRDSSCVIAHWGIASVLMGNPIAGAGPSAPFAERAQASLAFAARKTGGTQRERDYLAAVSAYWEDWSNRPERTRQINRSKAYESLAAKYPDDDEAQIFAALYLTATQSLSDQTYGTYLKAAETLERQFAKHPNHPGLAHYLIHSYDYPPIAEKGLAAAKRYSKVAASAAHAQHMPSHIFTRVGYWRESVAANRASAATDSPAKVQSPHAWDYMVYAYLQLGEDAAAEGVWAEAKSLKLLANPPFHQPFGLAAIPSRLALERGPPRARAEIAHAGPAAPPGPTVPAPSPGCAGGTRSRRPARSRWPRCRGTSGRSCGPALRPP